MIELETKVKRGAAWFAFVAKQLELQLHLLILVLLI